MKHVVLVGATDGIGRALARAYLARGWRVGVLGRDPAKLSRVLAQLRTEVPGGTVVGVPLDLRHVDEIAGALERVIRELGQMDVLIYPAGVMPPYSDDLDERLAGIDPVLDVNVRGALHVLERAADYFEAVGEGRIVALGSVAGDRGRRGHPVYGASKAALHQYLEGLRHRLHGSGVGVTTVKPGWVRTRMLGDEAARSPLAVDVDRAATSVIRGVDRGRDVLYVPWWWGGVAWVLRRMPRFLFKRVAPP